ncbi:MAG TPA: response regulator [Dehalococcoidia bacterium]
MPWQKGLIGDKEEQSVLEKKILVVDDEPHVIRTLTFVLRKEGYEVSSAGDGEEAMAKVRESKPNLMFLDVMMPKKNGYEVCQELKNNSSLSDIYVVMISAKGQEADKEKALSLGADEFITKPFSPMGVIERVKELLG